MTDNEIIKALELHSDMESYCTDICPYSQDDYYCDSLRARGAIVLFNRQKAEVERLQQKYELSEAEREANVKGFTETLKTVRAEAIKEFAERLKEKADRGFWQEHSYVDVEDIDNLVKEMTEDEGK